MRALSDFYPSALITVSTQKIHALNRRETGIAAIQSSQVLAQLSTVRNADGLICRVRNGSGSFPVAMAAMPIYIMFNLLFIKLQRKHREIVVTKSKGVYVKSQDNPNTTTSPVSGSCIA